MLNANAMSFIGYGTWPGKGEECTKAVQEALKLGFVIFDTATFYDNFEAIAEGIKDADREKLTIISKVWPTNQSSADLKQDLEATLQRLNTPYIDIYLLHWPNSSISIKETLQTMEELRKAGKIKEIGVSNFTINHLKKALKQGIPISWNQMELSPQFYDASLLAFCHAHGIKVQAYSPLGIGSVIKDPILTKLGAKYGKTSAQIALRWVFQHQALALPGSRNPTHMSENLAIFDFKLTEEEMEIINTQAKNGERNRITPEFNLGYVDEFDFSYEECWPKDVANSPVLNEVFDLLMNASNQYIDTLKKIGSSESSCLSEAILPLCAKNCRKVRNGKLLFEEKGSFPMQLDAGKQWLGSWLINVLDVVISVDRRTATILYELETEKEGRLTIIAVLYFAPDFLISKIEEVHNRIEK